MISSFSVLALALLAKLFSKLAIKNITGEANEVDEYDGGCEDIVREYVVGFLLFFFCNLRLQMRNNDPSFINYPKSKMTTPEIELKLDVYSDMDSTRVQEIKHVYKVARQTFQKLWNSMITNEEEIDNLNEKISVGNGELSCKSMTEIVYVMENMLPPEFRLNPNKSHFTDLGSGYGLSLMHTICQTNQALQSYSGIEVEESRFIASEKFAKDLNYDQRVSLLKNSFNSLSDPSILNVMQTTTHFYAFDWVFTLDTIEKLSSFLLSNRKTWLVLVSFRPPTVWKTFGMDDTVVTCFAKLPRRKMHKQTMTAYFYLNKQHFS